MQAINFKQLAEMAPLGKLRDGSAAQINERTLTITLDTGQHKYEVDLERCNTPGQVLDWIFQVFSKRWATPELMYDFLEALNVACHRFHGTSVQGCLCSFGANKRVKWSK
ncbi:MAG: hypothetical protein JW883_04360 [Deltaproteobacteria bacterium]|nr:hypothetical protein [Deltaproteobacteria bacterium]